MKDYGRHTSIEFNRTLLAHATAGKLPNEIGQKMSKSVDIVSQFGNLAEVKIVDVDIIVGRDEVLIALCVAIPDTLRDTDLVRPTMVVTGLWSRLMTGKSGYQVAAAYL